MEYGFNIELAQKLGLNEAIMIRYFMFWIDKNKANERNFYDGRYWTYNTLASFGEIFPFWSKDQIRYTLKKLSEKNILITGNYNKNPYDKTLWYSINNDVIAELMKSDDEILPNADGNTPASKCENPHIDVGNFPHRSGKIPTPIPVVNTIEETYVNTHESACEIFSIQEGVDEFCEDYKAIKGCKDLTNKERDEILKVLKIEKGYDKEFWRTVFQKSLGGWEINEGGCIRNAPCGLKSILENYGEIYRNEKGLKKISLPKKDPPKSEIPIEPEIFDIEAAEIGKLKARAIFEQIKHKNIGLG